MNTALVVLGLAAVVLAVTALCRRLSMPAPLVLVVVGIICSFVPWVPQIEISSELVLLGLLPPLLYGAAIRTSLIDIRRNIRTISLLAIGLVLATMAAVGFLTWWLLPIPLAAALAFGAVVAPPDAVAATAVARRIGLPRRVVTILEGESLLNDATALVALGTAALALTQRVSVGSITLDFVVAAGGGALLGFVVFVVAAWLRKRLTDTVSDTSLSFMIPFVAYIPAEEISIAGAHPSGVISVVVCGLLLGQKAPIVQDAQSRLSERINWNTIQFLLENAVFLLLGLQLRGIISDLTHDDLGAGTVVLFCAGALVAAMVIRPVWIFGLARGVLRWSRVETSLSNAPVAHLAIVSWAGMRGVVTIAAAFLLPEDTPHRPALVLGAFTVTAGTLLLQGLSLPGLARLLKVRGPDRREDVLQEASVLQAATSAGLAELDRARLPGDSDEVLDNLRAQAQSKPNKLWERLGRPDDEPPSKQFRRLRLAMLEAERAEVLRIRDTATVDQEVLASVMAAFDLEEAIMTVYDEDAGDTDTDLLTPPAASGDCEHLRAASDCAMPKNPDQGCLDCKREGTVPVHLRMCLSCGNIGCCDSSVGLHARRHYDETGHAVMRSFEPGELWRWCYVDELLG